ncbi:MAG: hypothetical protein JWM82_3495 [Myxococcales bacterium]|nr:hypothetical protein [Myxococcales bacterium]
MERTARGATLLFCVLPVIATSCATGQQSQVPTAKVTDELVTFTVPSVKPIEAGSETQKQKQTIVSVIPRAFTVSNEPRKDCVPGPESTSLLSLMNVNVNGKAPKKAYVVTTQTGVDYEPKTLSFLVKFVNHSQKVMHLDELYLKVTVNNQEVEVSKLDIGKIKQAVLLKGDESQFPLSVPEWQHDAGDATIDVSLQNVPIELDKVGHASETGDFRWTFKATLETKQVQSKKTIENLMLDPAEAASLSCHPGGLAAN